MKHGRYEEVTLTSCALALACALASQSAFAAKWLWIGAHPDDEMYAAPMLGSACVDGVVDDCRLLVMTRGENGPCRLPEGCLPNVETVRVGEMQNAATVLDASLVLKYYDDVGWVGSPVSDVLSTWGNQAGSSQALIDDVKNEISLFNPDYIVTFHPDIGVTCHPAHMAASIVALNAINQLGFNTNNVRLITQTEKVDYAVGSGWYYHWIPSFNAQSPEIMWDANAYWSHLIGDMNAHPSQFESSTVGLVENAPSNEREMYYMVYTNYTSQSICK